MSDQPLISVITPSFNSEKTIRQTIESVLAQNYSPFEHIVVDGGSKDGTLAIVQEYPHLQWKSEKDEGLYHAMNKGVLRATGGWVVILNSDDCFRPEALHTAAAAFRKKPDWDAAFGDVVYVDGESREIFRRAEAIFDYDVLRYWENYVCHQTLFVRKAVYDRLGLYRYKDFLNSADYEFLLRMGRAKCSVGHIPFFLVNFRYHEHGQQADLRVRRNIFRENGLIRREYGVSPRWEGILSIYGRGLRQMQKLVYRGRCDLIPGDWILKKHRKAKTSFSSNRSIADKVEG